MKRYSEKELPKEIKKQMDSFLKNLADTHYNHYRLCGRTDILKRIEFVMEKDGPYYRKELALRWKRWRHKNRKEKAMKNEDVIKEMIKIDNSIRVFNKEIKDKIAELQKQCEHEWVYCSDPSGGNDSGYICYACGSETKHID